MRASDPLTIARRYHGAWTTKRFAEAIELPSPTLAVEVAVNDYPTAEALGQALEASASWSQASICSPR